MKRIKEQLQDEQLKYEAQLAAIIIAFEENTGFTVRKIIKKQKNPNQITVKLITE